MNTNTLKSATQFFISSVIDTLMFGRFLFINYFKTVGSSADLKIWYYRVLLNTHSFHSAFLWSRLFLSGVANLYNNTRLDKDANRISLALCQYLQSWLRIFFAWRVDSYIIVYAVPTPIGKRNNNNFSIKKIAKASLEFGNPEIEWFSLRALSCAK